MPKIMPLPSVEPKIHLGLEKLLSIVESLKEGVMVVTSTGTIEYINGAAQKLLCLNIQNPIGRSVEEVVWVAAIQRFVQETLQSDSACEDEAIIDTLDTERHVHLYGTPIAAAQGIAHSSLFVVTDITHRKHLELMRRDFVANVSHELKTPITVIRGFVETLLEGGPHTPEDSRRFMESIARQTERLSHLFDDVLALSRLEQEQERSRIIFGTHTLLPVLASIIQSYERQAHEKKIRMSLTCAEDVCAEINVHLFEQAIVNLVQNAIEYTPSDGEISIKVQRRGAMYAVCVRDTGCGIEAEYLPRIFERFYRIDQGRSRKLGGTGLGLAIVKHIAQVHGGSVHVMSTPGVGSEFVFEVKAV